MTKGPFASTDTLKDYLDVSVHTIRQWVRDGKIPRTSYLLIGNTYRFHIRAVQDALLYHNERRELTPKQREDIALKIVENLDGVASDAPSHIKTDKLEHAENKLQDQVDGVPITENKVDIGDDFDSILDDDL
jgi:excisionase family DNA binding protein